MKFTIDKTNLTKMLRILTSDNKRNKSERDYFLRVVAQNNTVTIYANKIETGCAAKVTEEGVCFFQYNKFLRLVRSYVGEKSLAIEVTAAGIQIGRTRISKELWEVTLFRDPRTAPLRLASAVTDKKRRKRSESSQSLL